jgi:hypothetical protein
MSQRFGWSRDMRLLNKNQVNHFKENVSKFDWYDLVDSWTLLDDKYSMRVQNSDLRPAWLTNYVNDNLIINVEL